MTTRSTNHQCPCTCPCAAAAIAATNTEPEPDLFSKSKAFRILIGIISFGAILWLCYKRHSRHGQTGNVGGFHLTKICFKFNFMDHEDLIEHTVSNGGGESTVDLADGKFPSPWLFLSEAWLILTRRPRGDHYWCGRMAPSVY